MKIISRIILIFFTACSGLWTQYDSVTGYLFFEFQGKFFSNKIKRTVAFLLGKSA